MVVTMTLLWWLGEGTASAREAVAARGRYADRCGPPMTTYTPGAERRRAPET